MYRNWPLTAIQEGQLILDYTTNNASKIGGVLTRAADLRIDRYAFYTATGGQVIGVLGMDVLGPNGAIIDFGAQKLYFYSR